MQCGFFLFVSTALELPLIQIALWLLYYRSDFVQMPSIPYCMPNKYVYLAQAYNKVRKKISGDVDKLIFHSIIKYALSKAFSITSLIERR